MVAPVLEEEAIRLLDHQLENCDLPLLFDGLANQTSLQRLSLTSNPLKVDGHKDKVFTHAVCQLTQLRELSLQRISKYFSNEMIEAIATNLPLLEELLIWGSMFNDGTLKSISKLKYLRKLAFESRADFTSDGSMGYIKTLAPGNRGLRIHIELGRTNHFSKPERDTTRRALNREIRGRLYVHLCADSMPEPESDHSEYESDRSEEECDQPEEECDQPEEKCDQSDDDNDSTKEEYEAKLRDQEAAFKAVEEKLIADHTAAIEALKAELEGRLADLQAGYGRVKGQLEAQLEATKTELGATKTTLESTNTELDTTKAEL
ncbi:hypothetical protein EJ06DRAFT_111792 [Trichodelitschia bisporula]|uniref:Uncharacterized protein n=1 Tax=Trichodelitschia bisporula TaxID=703511 RepID=A0A6G1HRF0_9PEZI|nr:hypothetical protein EJ06DRAFT_111792 [Trichodelitschia bisporula]